MRPAVAALLLAALLAACEGGLSPDMTPAGSSIGGFAGTVTVTPPWPPADSVYDLRVIAFRHYPPTNILDEYMQGRLEITDPLLRDTSSQTYTIQKDALAGTFEYIVVGWMFGPNPFTDWRVAGVYTTTGNPSAPSALTLQPGGILRGVDIAVDFTKLPPQPF